MPGHLLCVENEGQGRAGHRKPRGGGGEELPPPVRAEWRGQRGREGVKMGCAEASPEEHSCAQPTAASPEAAGQGAAGRQQHQEGQGPGAR